MASTYMGKPYYPAWLDNLAHDVTGEGPAWDGAIRGAVQRLVVNHRPRSSVLVLSRAMLERFAGTRLAKHWEGTP